MERGRKYSTVLYLVFLVLTLNLCGIRGSSTTNNNNNNSNSNTNINSRVYKPSPRNTNSFNSANYWPRDSYVDAAEYSANSGGIGSGTTGVSNNNNNNNGDNSYVDPSGGFQGGNGNVGGGGGQGNKGSGSDSSYGIPEQSSSYYSYGTPDYSYNKGVVSGGYGGGAGGGSGWKPDSPSYKFKYHVYPHPDPVESNGWGWSGEESVPCRRGEECDTQGGGKDSSGIAGLIGLLGLKGLLPVVALLPLLPLLLLPLLFLIPLPWTYFPPGTLPSIPQSLDTGLLKLGRGFSASVPSSKYNLSDSASPLLDGNYITVNPIKIMEKVEGARKFVMNTYDTIVKTDGKDGEKNSCVERFSCEIYTMSRNFNFSRYLDIALQKLLPFKSKKEQKDNLISRFSRGMSSGDCQSFACRPFFKAEKM